MSDNAVKTQTQLLIDTKSPTKNPEETNSKKEPQVDSKHVELLESLFSVIPDLFFFVDLSGTIIEFRAGNHDDLYLSPSRFLNKKIQDVLPADVGVLFQEAIINAKESCTLQTFEYRLNVSGDLKYFEARLNKHETYNKIPIIVRDITDRKEAENTLEFQANYDDLTGISNRRFALYQLNTMVANAQRRKEVFALAFIDLDDFKSINDTLGHDAGDAVLKEIAQRCKKSLRANDHVARIGGDEFIIILSGNLTPPDIHKKLNLLVSMIDQPILLGKTEIKPKVSIGVATYPADGKAPSTLLSSADKAMYHAKAQGKNKVFYCSDIT
jgi:diguanylate cyclase (GGDEF)-like protein/PAS domain S-box-containing protein